MKIACQHCGNSAEVVSSAKSGQLRCPTCRWKLVWEEAPATSSPAHNVTPFESGMTSPRDTAVDIGTEMAQAGPASDDIVSQPGSSLPETYETSAAEDDSSQIRSRTLMWTGYGTILVALLLVYPISELYRRRSAHQQTETAIETAKKWMEGKDIQRFETIYRELSLAGANRYVGDPEAIQKIQEQTVTHRDQLTADAKLDAATDDMNAGKWKEAQSQLLEYLIEDAGTRPLEAQRTLKEVQEQTNPLPQKINQAFMR